MDNYSRTDSTKRRRLLNAGLRMSPLVTQSC
jgi:hypothetical protein